MCRDMDTRVDRDMDFFMYVNVGLSMGLYIDKNENSIMGIDIHVAGLNVLKKIFCARILV